MSNSRKTTGMHAIKSVLALLLVACAISTAHAQTASGFTAGTGISSSAVNSMFGSKADVLNPQFSGLSVFGGQANFKTALNIPGLGATYPNTGLTLGWNITAGGGEADMLLGPQGGNGGLKIYQLDATGKIVGTTPIVSIGHLGDIIANSFTGSLNANAGSIVSTQNYYLNGTHAGAYNIMDGAFPAAGAACDGTTDDSGAINALASFVGSHGGGTLQVPGGRNCKVLSTVLLPQGVTLSGENQWTSQLTAGTAGMTVVSTAASGPSHNVKLAHFRLNAAGSAVAIYLGPTGIGHSVEDVFVETPCVGIDVNGVVPLVQSDFVDSVSGTGCVPIRVGFSTTGGGTVDARIVNTNVSGLTGAGQPDSGILLLDSGGIFMSHNDVIQTNYGTKTFPGPGQVVAFSQSDSTDFGDTTNLASLRIDNNGGKVYVFNVANSWASSATGDGIDIANTGGGVTAGIHLAGMAVYNNGLAGVHVFPGVTDWSIDYSHVCSNGAGGTNIFIEPTVSKFAIRNNDLKSVCDNFGPGTGQGGSFSSAVGIAFAGSSATAIITGNDFSGTTPSNGAPGQDSVVANNIGIDTVAPVVASANTITLPGMTSTFALTGSAAVQTINAIPWNNRKITLIPTSGAPTFITGGSVGGAICTAYTGTLGIPIEMFYSGCWYLK